MHAIKVIRGAFAMEQIKLGIWYDNDMVENANKIHIIAEQITGINETLISGETVSGEDLRVLVDNVQEVLDKWVGHTYIGHQKEKILSDAYQAFFNALYGFILLCRNSSNEDWQAFAKEALYEGTLYRYLGHNTSSERRFRVRPRYNNKWVSWSKYKEVDYIESKLCGSPITRLECHTGLIYGIDLQAFGASRPHEAEVVYPTIKSQIDNIEYL